MSDLEKIKDLEEKLRIQVSTLICKYKEISEGIKHHNTDLAELKTELSLVESEICRILQASGKTEEPYYVSGFKFHFEKQIVGQIAPGKEQALIRWCKKCGRESLLQIKVGKRALHAMLNQDVDLPESLWLKTYNEFKINKDRRKLD